MAHDGAGREPGRDDDEVVEKFRPTSGSLTGYLALALAAAAVVATVLGRDHGVPVTIAWAALLFGSLVWAAMLRPRVWVTRSDLVLRNMLDTVSIPLAAIEQIVVRQVLAVRAGDGRYVSPAVGKSWRQTLKSGRPRTDPALPVSDGLSLAPPGAETGTASYPEFVEARLHHHAEEARAKAGVALLSDEQLALAAGVRRDRAWPEIALLSVTSLGTVVSLLF